MFLGVGSQSNDGEPQRIRRSCSDSQGNCLAHQPLELPDFTVPETPGHRHRSRQLLRDETKRSCAAQRCIHQALG